jgi:hypothetical protein
MKTASLPAIAFLSLCATAFGQTPPSPPKAQVTSFKHQILGESINDFMRISGTTMCASHNSRAPQWCDTLKKVEGGEDGVVTDENSAISVSLFFSDRKLMRVLVQGKADWLKSVAEFSQTYGAPDAQATDSATWSFSDGGGIIVKRQPDDLFTATFYSKDSRPQAKEQSQAASETKAAPVATPTASFGAKAPNQQTVGVEETARPTLADASPYVTKMNGGRPVDCTATKVKVHFGSGRGEGYCQAVLTDLLKAWEPLQIAKQNLAKLIPAEKMPDVPLTAYELKGDKLGMSMAEYLKHHPDDCVLGNREHTGLWVEDPNSFHFSCTTHRSAVGPDALTLAGENVGWKTIDFSQQRLYRIAYFFGQSQFEMILAALEQKFGKPSSSRQNMVQNKFGAQFTRVTVIWTNGVSTITLSEMPGDDLTLSGVELTLNDIYSAVLQREGGKAIHAALNDM